MCCYPAKRTQLWACFNANMLSRGLCSAQFISAGIHRVYSISHWSCLLVFHSLDLAYCTWDMNYRTWINHMKTAWAPSKENCNHADKHSDEHNTNRCICLLDNIQGNPSKMAYNKHWSSWHHGCRVLSWKMDQLLVMQRRVCGVTLPGSALSIKQCFGYQTVPFSVYHS